MLRCTICDDNKTSVSTIHNMICGLYKDRFDFKLAYGVEDFESGDSGDCDILIMDIDLLRSDGVNSSGIDLAEELKHTNPGIQVIFVSAFHEYAQDIFKAEPVYYLQKPVSEEKLKIAIDKALKEIEKNRNNRFVFTVGGDIVSIPVSEILYFESDKRRMKAITVKEEHSFYSRVGDVEAMLDDRFVRCHQSFIINLEHVSSMRSNSLLMDNGCTIPVSQSRQKVVRVELTRFLGRTIA